MANTFKFGNKKWATKEGSVLAYNDENNNFKPLPFDFTRASSATRVNENGLIEVVGSNEPRIDYLNNTSGHLLLEPSRTNLALYSEEFDNAAWAGLGLGTASVPSVTANYGIAPDGSLTADRIQFDLNGGTTASDRSIKRQSITSQTDYVISFYVKSNTATDQKLLFHWGTDSDEFTATSEWQRFTLNKNGTSVSYIGLSLLGSLSSEDTADVLVWGAQVEQGSYATSYIPTSGSAVTRAADSCLDAGNSSVFNDSEGTLFLNLDFGENHSASRYISLNDDSNSNRIQIGRGGTVGSLSYFVSIGGVTQVGVVLSEGTGQKLKLSIRYKANDYSIYSNGVEIYSNTSLSSTPTGLDNFTFSTASGGEFFGKAIECKYYNTALTAAELIALTS